MPTPAGSIFQVTYRYSAFGQQLMNVMHYRVLDDTPDDPIAVSEALASRCAAVGVPDEFAGGILAVIPVSVSLDFVRAQMVYPTRFSYRDFVVGDVGVRGLTDTVNIDVSITKRTDAAGRDQVGTFHLPGIAQADMANGVLDPDFKASVTDAMSWLIMQVVLAGTLPTLEPVLWHQTLGGQADTITSYTVQDEVRVIRRRTVRVGI